MFGGAQSFLLLCDDGYPYVVKFQNNGQHLRVLANEWMAAKLMKHLQLPVPLCDIVQVDQSLIEATPELSIVRCDGGIELPAEPCLAGKHFGSRCAGGLLPSVTAVDYLPQEDLLNVANLTAFCGALAFDKWVCNRDSRQAVFHKKYGAVKYKAQFIDHGHCFGGIWGFIDIRSGTYPRHCVYRQVRGWASFEPWLTQIEEISADTIWGSASTIPTEWYDDDRIALEELVTQLERRRSRVREIIVAFRNSDGKPFPNWLPSKY